ncbi:hypothetical protein HHK36_025904 [Tetracentron sinense]|uniref:WRKY domain-containing protein n=1 Tax=Tetracentron sinense TaxID=13715 RepID=A0A834YP35_TETSI|nr:hypothetical protein HHK36_025904 [Tetracentron sinense]
MGKILIQWPSSDGLYELRTTNAHSVGNKQLFFMNPRIDGINALAIQHFASILQNLGMHFSSNNERRVCDACQKGSEQQRQVGFDEFVQPMIMDAHEDTSHREKVEAIEAELERLCKENEMLSLMLEDISSKYNTLQAHLQEKKIEEMGRFIAESCSIHDWSKRTQGKVSQVVVRTNARDNSLIVQDGCQWRKYGQKVTKNNPSPRAYFRCSMAPDCPVKKKVQRCIEDDSVVVATYEGEHNHAVPGAMEGLSSSSHSSIEGSIANIPCSTMIDPFRPTITLDLILTGAYQNIRSALHNFMEETNNIHNNDNINIIQEYVASLT